MEENVMVQLFCPIFLFIFFLFIQNIPDEIQSVSEMTENR